MNRVFIDSSALVALINADDESHAMSKSLLEKVRSKRLALIMTDYVFDETITTVLSRAGHKLAVLAGNLMLDSSFMNVVWLDQEIKLRAWEFFLRHSDKNFSFTDCTSFVLMRELGINRYLSFDDHFKQAGFINFSADFKK